MIINKIGGKQFYEIKSYKNSSINYGKKTIELATFQNISIMIHNFELKNHWISNLKIKIAQRGEETLYSQAQMCDKNKKVMCECEECGRRGVVAHGRLPTSKQFHGDECELLRNYS